MATVLIADDDAAVRRLLSAVLRPRGHTIIEAGNGEQALALAESQNPHLIVSDLLMPAMDGYELVRRLRIQPSTAQTPVIFLTAEYDEGDATELARSAGVTRVLRKPCKPSDVLEAVDLALGESPKTDANEITGSYAVRHVRLMTDKLTRQAEELRAANVRLESHAARLEVEVAERKSAAEKLSHLNRVHAMVSSINAVIVRVHERDQLLEEACRMAVEHGKFQFAWIGLTDAEAKSCTPVACAGTDPKFAEQMGQSSPIEALSGRSLIHEALTLRAAAVCNDIAAAESQLRFGPELVQAGHRAAIVLPLIVDGKAAGVFCLYTAEPGFFNEGETKLLRELAGQVSFALDHIVKTERLDYLAYYDALTGLANRTLLLQRLARDLEAAAGRQTPLALVVFDIDRFENINDSFGRHVGDQVLKSLVGRLLQCLGDPGRVARVGPDEIVALIPEARSENDVARSVMDWSTRVFSAPFRTHVAELRLSGKAGIAMFPGDGADPETLLKHAQTALKKCKSTADTYLFYTQDMSSRTAERLAMEIKLRDGLEKEEFLLQYQPKIDTRTGRLVGVEALLRWQSPELGLVPPGNFIPLMEETGIIVEAGRWALRRAIADRRRWTDAGLQAPRVAINVSTVELRKQDFVDVFAQTLELGDEDHGIDIEVTESIIMDDVTANIAKLLAIRELGVDIAIDDFGTGYSSLAYLARLPVQALKIDRTFVSTMLDDASAMTLVSTMISLARSLKLTVVAEGVEQEEQARMLRLLRCDQMQGYLFDKPLSFEEMSERLKNRRAWLEM
ncbi:MAG: EAL domain-containing protein [Gammaproteobacteria bacterium]